MRDGGQQASWRAFHAQHPNVSSRQFGDGWAAMELELSRSALELGGVAAAHIARALALSLGALALLLALLTVGTEGLGDLGAKDSDPARRDDASLVAVVEALLTLGCALLVVACRPRTRAEIDADGVAADLIDAEMVRAAED